MRISAVLASVASLLAAASSIAQQPILTTYAEATFGTLTRDPQATGLGGGGATGVAQPVSLKWRHRGVGLDGTWREPWAIAQLAANPGDPAALGDAGVGDVRLATGEYAPTEIDLHLPSHGPEWIIGRSRRPLSAAVGTVHGRGWHQVSQAQIMAWDRTGSPHDMVFLVYGGDRYAEYRRVMNGNSPTQTYRGVNGAAGAFTYVGSVSGGAAQMSDPIGGEAAINLWTYHDPTGITVTFFGANASRTDSGNVVHVGSWQIWKITDAAGEMAYVGHPTDPAQAILTGYDSSGRITTAFDSAGRQYSYAYGTVGGVSRLLSVTATLGSTTVGTVNYTYYTSNTGDGYTGDLQAATTLTPTLASDIDHTTMYRYWTPASGAQTGFDAGSDGSVRLVVPPETIRRASSGAGLGGVPSWTDSQWAADGATRFGYDSAGRVEAIVADALADNPYAIRYESPTTAVSATNGYDTTWAGRAVVLDQSVVASSLTLKRATTTYFDELGQSLSRIVTEADPASSTSAFWCTFVERDAKGCVTTLGSPASTSAYSHGSGTGTVTAASGGLTRRFLRFTSTTNPTLEGFVETFGHSSGWTGSVTSDVLFVYRSISSGTRPCKALTGYTIYRPLIEGVTRYPTETTTVSEATTLSYTLPNTTVAPNGSSAALTIDWIVTTHPVVGWSQHGSGTAAVSAVAFARNGLVTHVRSVGSATTGASWEIPGSMTVRSYDTATGLLTQIVEDSTASPGAGFPSPSSAANPLVTDYVYDAQGRLVTRTEYGADTSVYQKRVFAHSRLADGRPASVEGVEVSAGTFASPGSYVVRNLRGAVAGAGKVVFGGTADPDGLFTTTTAPAAWISSSSLSALRPLASGLSIGSPVVTAFGPGGVRAAERRAYHTIPSSGDGSTAEYDLTELLYDERGLLVRSIDPSRTITALGYDALDRTTGLWRGVETGSGESLKAVVSYEYDGGASGGNSLTTKIIRHTSGDSVSAADDRVTLLAYDDRGRTKAMANPASPHIAVARDNLGRVTATGFYGGTTSAFWDSLETLPAPTVASANRLGAVTASYDAMGRVYRRTEAVNSSSVLEEVLSTNIIHDMRSRPALVMGRQTTQYTYGDSGPCGCSATTVSVVAKSEAPDTYAECIAVQSTDAVLHESHTIWAPDGRTIAGYATVERHPTMAMLWEGVSTAVNGPLSTSNFIVGTTVNYGEAPHGRVSTVFMVRDSLRRTRAVVDFGNAGYEPRTGPAGSFTRSLSQADIVSSVLPFKLSRTDYDARGFIQLSSNERGDATWFTRDELGRETEITRARGLGGTDPAGVGSACQPPEVERRKYDGGRLESYCVGTFPMTDCPDFPQKMIEFVYGDSPAASGWPYSSNDTLLDNNVPRSILYPGSLRVGSSLPDELDRTDFARNTMGELLIARDNGDVETIFTLDEMGREVSRSYVFPTSTDGFGLPEVDSLHDGAVTSYDSWGRAVGIQSNTADDFQIERGPWGQVTRARQEGVALPDGDIDDSVTEIMFPEDWDYRRGYEFISESDGGGAMWQGVRPTEARIPGMYNLTFDPAIEIYYAGAVGIPGSAGGAIEGVDIDAIVGRPSKTTYLGETWEANGYFGIWKPAAEWIGPARIERIDYAPYRGMAILPGDDDYIKTGLDPWGNPETDYWRYCAGINPCTQSPEWVEDETPLIGNDSTVRPQDLCAAGSITGKRCEIRTTSATDPRDNRQIEIQCAGSVKMTEYTGVNPGGGVSVVPHANRRVDYRGFDRDGGKQRGNLTSHKRLFRPTPTGSESPALAGEFEENRDYTEELASPNTGHGSDQSTLVTRTDVGSLTEYIETRYDARGHQRNDWGVLGISATTSQDRAFQYDAVGRLSEVRKIESGSAVGSSRLFAKFTYDGLGRRTSARYARSNAVTSLADDSADLYIYDDAWRVVGVAQADPTVSGGQVTGYSTWLRERYVYSPAREAADGRGGDTPIGREIDYDGDGYFETQQFFATDRQGSVVAILQRVDADDNGEFTGTELETKLIARVAYTAFGEPEIYRPTDTDRDGLTDADDLTLWESWYDGYTSTNPTIASEHAFLKVYLDYNADGVVDSWDETQFGVDHAADATNDYGLVNGVDEEIGALPLYAGYWWDPELRLYHVRHRVYDPQAGRWLQRDPIGYEGGPNLYQYSGNEPWNFTDPMGLDWLDDGANAAAGVADGISFGLTRKVREFFGIDETVDYTSSEYKTGTVVGAAYTVVAVAVATGGTSTVVMGGAVSGAVATVRGGLSGNGVQVSETIPAVIGGAVSGLIPGGSGWGGAIFGGMLSGAVGDAAQQSAEIAMGLRCQYDWQQTAEATLLGGMFGVGGKIVSSSLARAKPIANRSTLDALEGGGRRGGVLYGARRLEKLRNYLHKRGIATELHEPGSPGAKTAFDYGEVKLHLRTDATQYEVWHEMYHIKQYRAIGHDKYFNLPRDFGNNVPEQFVYDMLRTRRWNRINFDESADAIRYLERRWGGNAW
jgi:RHS repeat-associated protein